MRRCRRGSEGTRNSHEVKIWTWRRISRRIRLLWERVWHCTRICKTPTGQNAITDSFDAHPPKDKKLAAAVRCCRVQEAWGGTHVKFDFRLSPAKITFETNVTTALEQSGGDRLYGQAPRGSLERKALDLLQKLGVQIDKPIGSWLCSTYTVDGGDSPLSVSVPSTVIQVAPLLFEECEAPEWLRFSTLAFCQSPFVTRQSELYQCTGSISVALLTCADSLLQ